MWSRSSMKGSLLQRKEEALSLCRSSLLCQRHARVFHLKSGVESCGLGNWDQMIRGAVLAVCFVDARLLSHLHLLVSSWTMT